jgi:Lycopene cyclase
MATPSELRTPWTDAQVVAGVILTMAIPAILTLRAVRVPQDVVPVADNPTPLGYTRSLSLFVVPAAMLAWWFLRHPDYRFQRKAFGYTLAGLIPVGFLLDILFGHAFFTFENRAATVGVAIPVVGGSVPVEEFVFYALGFLTMLLLYIWCDEYWFGAYKVPDYHAEARGMSRVIRFHLPSLLIGLALAGAGVVYKRFFSGTPGLIPGYYLFLVSTALVPSMFLFPTALPFVNWRALSFTYVLLQLVSLLWEATLAAPYQWWGYRAEQMLGLTIGAWTSLPIEAVLLWMVSTYTTVIVYEVVKVVVALDRPLSESLFGKKG